MKVALLSPFIHPISEPFVGGTEAFVHRFAMSLHQHEIEVVCYGCEGSRIPGVETRSCGVSRGAIVYPRAAHELNGEEILAIRASEDAIFYQAFDDALNDPSIDILHNHSFSGIPFYLSRFLPLPIVHTLHLPPMLSAMVESLRFCQQMQTAACVVGVSHAQARLWQRSYPVTRVIYNGPSVAIETIPHQHRHNGTLIFAGRIDPGKGVEDAIQVASVLGKKLNLYGAPQPINTTYFETRIQPLLKMHSNVTYHGLVDQQTLFHQLSHAQALLLPIKWDEPLSTIVIEAISLGTPAVMYDRGSAHELIVEGTSGYVVPPDDLAALADAVERTESLDRSTCAAYAREYFSLEKCVKEYINLYTNVVQSSNWS